MFTLVFNFCFWFLNITTRLNVKLMKGCFYHFDPCGTPSQTKRGKYFTEGRCLADHEMLVEAAKEAQVPTEAKGIWSSWSSPRELAIQKPPEKNAFFYSLGYLVLSSWDLEEEPSDWIGSCKIMCQGLLQWLQSGEGTWEIQRKYAEIFYGCLARIGRVYEAGLKFAGPKSTSFQVLARQGPFAK